MSHEPDPNTLKRWVAPRLLAWFAAAQRNLPWRRDRDPYRIWVSEVMLQQTQVATVIPSFERFMQVYPTVTALAVADEQDVLRLWEGLGYYRRARDLHRSARKLVAERQGVFPTDPEGLKGYPGLGRYTRNAVLSQAFDVRLPILEVNTVRVLCRLFARTEDPTKGPLQRWLWKAAEALLPAKQAGAFNQALMELGSLVCTPTNPRCSECPLAARCLARKTGTQEQIPYRTKPPAIVKVREAAVVLRRGDRVLLVQRPATGRWANLWEFPHGPLLDGETYDVAAQRLIEPLTGYRGQIGAELTTISHTVTRYAITLVCFEATYESGDFQSTAYVRGDWLSLSDLANRPVSSPQRRLIRRLLEPSL